MSGTPSVHPVAKFEEIYRHWGLTLYNKEVDKTISSIKNVLKLLEQDYLVKYSYFKFSFYYIKIGTFNKS